MFFKTINLFRKILPIFSWLIVSPNSANAQNIVPNPNFSQYWGCPDNSGQIDSCKFWFTATQGTVDYYNICSDTTFNFYGHAPNNYLGYQVSPSSAYAGIVTYNDTYPFTSYKEYLEVPIPALEVGGIYKVTVNVSLADSVKYASDGMGVYFYINAKPDSSNFNCLTNTPQIDYTSYGIITDKVNWTTLTADFVADSSYTHLVIGNFKCDTFAHLSISPYYASGLDMFNTSYYYVDSVSVEKIGNVNTQTIRNNLELKLFPNPVNNQLFIDNVIERTKYKILSVTGVPLRQNELYKGMNTISMAQMPHGIYFLELTTEDGVRIVRQVIKD